MWRTPSGDRTLHGAEGSLVRALVAQVLFDLEMQADSRDLLLYGVSLFDKLEWPQKIALLALVGPALLDEHIPPPPLNAINEACVAVLFEALVQELQYELDSENGLGAYKNWWRTLILAAIRETDGDDGHVPPITSPDFDEWDVILIVLRDRILWDEDWDMPDLVMDKTPEHSRFIKRQLAIPDDYYTGIAPDPSEAELSRARQVLRDLTASVDR